jgi:hypothetical protein
MEKYAKPLLAAADLLGMLHLKAYCEQYFYENLRLENVLETVKLTLDCNSGDLKEECLELIEE